MSEYSYPVELIKRTKIRIQKQLDGNGVDPKTVQLKIHHQGEGTFTACTRYELDVEVKNSFSKGRRNDGRVVGQGEAKTEIDQYADGLLEKDTFDTMAKDLIKSLSLSGFGVKKDKLPLKGESLKLTEHIPCQTCQAKGQSTCPQCRGQGHAPCQFCYGHGMKQCMLCNGTGQLQNGNQTQICTQCQGRREVFCPECQGQRTVTCNKCQARGIITCGDCGGEGTNSIFYTATPILNITSDIFIADLDNEPKNYVAKLDPVRLVEKGHITIKTTEPPVQEEVEHAYYEDAPEDPNKNAVFYEATMPWCSGDIVINNTPYKIALIGTKGAVAECKNFMDKMIEPATDLFRDAAAGQGYIAGLLKDACAYRVSRETLSALTRMKPKKAMMEIAKIYGVGLSKQTLQTFVKHGHKAMKNITRRPRYIGLAIGLGLSAAINYIWFLNGARDMTSTLEDNMRYAIDGGIYFVTLIITIALIKGLGYFAFQSLMRDIGIQTKKMPALGTAGIYAFCGNLLIWGGCLGFLTFFSDMR